MFEEMVFQMFGINAAASCTSVKLAVHLFDIPDGAVNGNDVRCFFVIREGEVVRVGEVGDLQCWMLVGKMSQTRRPVLVQASSVPKRLHHCRR